MPLSICGQTFLIDSFFKKSYVLLEVCAGFQQYLSQEDFRIPWPNLLRLIPSTSALECTRSVGTCFSVLLPAYFSFNCSNTLLFVIVLIFLFLSNFFLCYAFFNKFNNNWMVTFWLSLWCRILSKLFAYIFFCYQALVFHANQSMANLRSMWGLCVVDFCLFSS